MSETTPDQARPRMIGRGATRSAGRAAGAPDCASARRRGALWVAAERLTLLVVALGLFPAPLLFAAERRTDPDYFLVDVRGVPLILKIMEGIKTQKADQALAAVSQRPAYNTRTKADRVIFRTFRPMLFSDASGRNIPLKVMAKKHVVLWELPVREAAQNWTYAGFAATSWGSPKLQLIYAELWPP